MLQARVVGQGALDAEAAARRQRALVESAQVLRHPPRRRGGCAPIHTK
jgi:hypothetical protein